MTLRLAVIADTHFPTRGAVLPPACVRVLAAADAIVHAGDLTDMATLEMLRAIGPPVIAVHGNADGPAVRAALPPQARVELAGMTLAVTHSGGPEQGRLARMRRRFPGVRGVVFGHSHIPLHQVDPDGFFILNPGSPTDRRRQPRHTMAEIAVDEPGAPVRVSFLAVDDPAGPLPDDLVRRSAT